MKQFTTIQLNVKVPEDTAEQAGKMGIEFMQQKNSTMNVVDKVGRLIDKAAETA